MYCIIGTGIWGATMAERIATVLKEKVLVVDQREHIGGNSASFLDEETGIECHRYGSHIFHTSIQEVWDYLRQFCEFTTYRHKVLTTYAGKVYTMPINLETINSFYGKNLHPYEVKSFLAEEIAKAGITSPKNLEEQAISLIGRPLYEAFIKGYTEKQWECDPKQLPASIIQRLPLRFNYNNDYFNDTWQGVPKDGYFTLFKNILNHPNITLRLNTTFEEVRAELPTDTRIIYTGMPDQLFQYKYGELEWRSLRFEWETKAVQDYQGTTVMNYSDADVPYTRIHEFKHYHPERQEPFQCEKTVICREYPQTYDRTQIPCYPVNNQRNTEVYALYAREAEQQGILLGGRLGAYRYWDMDKAVENALHSFRADIMREGV